jgi:hypothetical protein
VGTIKIQNSAVTDAKLADAKMSLASGGTVLGTARFQGTVPASPSGGVYCGGGATNDAVIKIAGLGSGHNAYIDFGYTGVSNRGRIIVGSSGVMQLSATGGVTLVSAATCSSTMTCTGALTCNGGITVPAGKTVTLAGVAYNLPPATVSGTTWPSLAAVGSTGVMQVGRHIDFTDASAEAVDYDVRLTCTGSTLSCSGSFAAAGLTSSSGLTVSAGSSSFAGQVTASAGLVVSANGADITGPVVCRSSLEADSASVTSSLTLGGVSYAFPTVFPTLTGGSWSTARLLAVGTDGLTELGRYLDFHHTSLDGLDFVHRMNARSDALEVGGNFAIVGALSCNSTVNTTGQITAGGGLTVSANGANITGPVVCSSSLAANSASVTNDLTVGGVVTRLQHYTQAFCQTAANIAPNFPVVLPLSATQNVRGTNMFNTSTKRWTVPVNGLYLMAIRWQCLTTSVLTTMIYKNGVVEAFAYIGQLTHVLYLTTTDYLEVQVSHPDSVARALYTDAATTSVTLTSL